MKSYIAGLPLLAATVSAHATFQALWVDGVQTGIMGTSPVRHDWEKGNNSPIKDVTIPEIACNYWATPKAKKVSVKAGSTVTSEWHHNNNIDPNDKDEPIAASHKGPVMAYLGKVDNSATASVDGVKWFKIYEDAKDSAGKWGVDRLYANKGKVDFTIPSCVADGDYFLRVEVIGLHEADRAGGAQLYPECAQISITGGGNANPPTVSFPGAYTQDGVGLSYNLYSGNAPYTAPGPRPFTCGASSGGSPAPAPAPSSPASSAPAPAPTTLRTSTRATSVRPVTTSSVAAPAPTQAAPTSAAAPQPSNPSTPGAPSKAEIESFFASIMELYNTWKGQA